MAEIVVCPLDELPATLAKSGARHMISLSGPGKTPQQPSQIDCGFLALEFNDIAELQDGLIAPKLEDMEAILAFAQNWDHATPLLVHCWMGISRSTAAALAICAAHNPDSDMNALAVRLRAASPMATPNPLMIAHADAAVGLNGRLVAAVACIGRGADASLGQPFTLKLGDA